MSVHVIASGKRQCRFFSEPRGKGKYQFRIVMNIGELHVAVEIVSGTSDRKLVL